MESARHLGSIAPGGCQGRMRGAVSSGRGASPLEVAMPLNHSPETHKNLIARIPSVTGRDLPEWLRKLESGPAFLRCAERAHWLSGEHGLSPGYARAIVHAYELGRPLSLDSV